MTPILMIRAGVLVVLLAIPATATGLWIGSAEDRLDEMTATPTEKVATASAADVEYCSPELKKILRRVLMSCGLVGGDAARGCQPVQAKNVATMSGTDFNALFRPMKERGGIIQFEKVKADLDAAGTQLIDTVFADQQGASRF